MKTIQLLKGLSLTCTLGISSLVYCQHSSSSSLPSNTEAFGQGTNVINVGVGFGGDYGYLGNGISSTPNFVLSYDNGTFGNVGPGTISLGGLLTYKGATYSYTSPYSPYYNYNQTWYYYIIGFRSAYHWNFTTNSHFDPYAGLMLAYYDVGFKASSNDPYFNNPSNPYYYYSNNTYNSYVGLSLYLGARYYVSPHVGFWLELGFGYSNLALGVSFKF